MALLFSDSFDHYTTATINQKYDVVSGASIVGSGRKTSCLQLANGQYVQKTLGTQTSLYIGFATYNTIGGELYIDFIDSSTVQCRVIINTSSGIISIYRGTGTLLTSAFVYLTLLRWYYIEIKAVIDQTTGSVEIKISGNTELTYSGDTTSTANNSANAIKLLGGSNSSYVDDLYITNSAFLGDSRVKSLLPTANGNYAQWSPSFNSNYQNVDDPQASAPCPDGDATYNFSNTAPNRDSFIFANMESPDGTISSVQIYCNVKKDDGSARTMRVFVRIGGTDYFSGALDVTSGYKFITYSWDTNPATLGAWTVSDINDAEFGYEFTS